jgi:DNA-binding beta-propeller fold protein YncE
VNRGFLKVYGLVAAVSLWSACGEETSSEPDATATHLDASHAGRDAQPPDEDAAAPLDASAKADATMGLDAAAVPDGGAMPQDTGAVHDAGVLPDAAEIFDAALVHDAGLLADGAVVFDAGLLYDAGLPPDASSIVHDAGLLASDAGAPLGDAGLCSRPTPPDDYTRKVVLSHPFDVKGNPANTYDVYELSSTGTVTTPPARVSFTMGVAAMGQIVFTPDGQIGFVAQDDGTIGEFKFDSTGAPVVLNANYKAGFYASKVVVDPDGQRLYVLDEDWANNGGGVYSLAIGCDGTLTSEGMIFPSKLAYAMTFMPAWPGETFLFAQNVLSSVAGANAQLLGWGPPPVLLGSAAAFPDDEAIVSDARVTPDGRWALITDNSSFGSSPNRVAVVELQAHAVVPTEIVSPFNDPAQVVPSPYGDAAIVIESQGNGIQILSYDASKPSTPFSLKGPVTYSGAKPQLPTVAIAMDRGTLRGRVLISELEGIRQVRFETGGAVTDLGLTSLTTFLTGYESITGAMGVQP